MKHITLWFGLATFWCSALIFWVEPLIGKQLLPLLGGAPSVWNVCLLFFQLALLAGYLLAHALTRLKSARVQGTLYVAVAIAAVVSLPVSFDDTPPASANPTIWLLGQLALQLLLPFVALAAAAPLLQHWYSRSRAAAARDPYFLYAASNAGSLIALLLFPVLIEPQFAIAAQNVGWAALFAAGVLVTAAASTQARRATAASRSEMPDSARHAEAALPARTTALAPGTAPGGRDVAMWMLLAAVPSSLLMGVTTHLTADIAPVPLLWIVPLALYLGTFIVAFGWLRGGPPALFGRLVVVMAVVWSTLYRIGATDPLRVVVIIHLVAFTVLVLGAHARLAQRRPDAAHLTTFYIAIAVGGALGGVFNALIAPTIFESYLEYPLAMVLAVWLNLGTGSGSRRADLAADVLPAAGLGLLVAAALWLPVPDGAPRAIAVVILPVAIAYMMSERTLRFTLALSVILLSARWDRGLHDRVLHAERNFYGLLRVTTDEAGRHHELLHGTTLHGAMAMTGPRAGEPLTYYWTGSPVAATLRHLQQRQESLAVGVVGLGVGALAWYARPDERWTFYEINPAVTALARDTSLFTFLSGSSAGALDVVPGDARLRLQDAAAHAYDVLVLDAFTSDAIPLHILTYEAVALYLEKLRPGGVLVFHVSNRYLDLTPPIAAVGRAHGLRTYLRIQQVEDEESAAQRITSSDWLVLARSPADFPLATTAPGWLEAHAAGARVWTDDYSNIWTAFAR